MVARTRIARLMGAVAAAASVVCAAAAIGTPAVAQATIRVDTVHRTIHARPLTNGSAPKLTGVRPRSGDVSGRNSVALSGRLSNVATVYFGTNPARIKDVRPNRILVAAPKHPAGKVRVKLLDGSGHVIPAKHGHDSFTYRDNGAPKITTKRLPTATRLVSYEVAFATADDRRGTWSITAGHLPNGIRHETSRLFGTPTTVQKRTFTITFTDKNGQRASRKLGIHVLEQHWRQDNSNYGDPACTDSACYRIEWGESVTISGESGGGTWTAQDIDPGNVEPFDGATVADIACGASICAAVGDYEEDDDPDQVPLFALTFENGTWTASKLPGEAELTDVDCSDARCIAVGPDSAPADPAADQPRILTMTNGDWTESHPSLSGSDLTGLDLTEVGCGPDGSCAALGVGKTGTGDWGAGAISVAANGTTSAQTLPEPAGASGQVTVYSVSCNAADDCVALARYGTDGFQDGSGTPYYLRRSGSAWTAHDLPVPAGADAGSMTPSTVACNGVSVCYLVGHAQAHNAKEPVVIRFAGTTRTMFVPVFPDGAADVGKLDAVTCAHDGQCFASGLYRYAAHGVPPLEQLAFAHLGTSAADTPMQRVTGEAFFGGLSCADNAMCVGNDKTKLPA